MRASPIASSQTLSAVCVRGVAAPRHPTPTGGAVGLELVYTSTDPPVKMLRRIIPPLRIGGVSLDLSIMILWIAILALRWVALGLA